MYIKYKSVKFINIYKDYYFTKILKKVAAKLCLLIKINIIININNIMIFAKDEIETYDFRHCLSIYLSVLSIFLSFCL